MRRIGFAVDICKSWMNQLSKPYKLNWYLTNRCNSKCTICKIWQKSVDNELDLDEIRKFLNKNNHFAWIDVTGGEIFMREDIDKILDLIIQKCKNLYILHFPTNGTQPEKIVKTVRNIKKKFSGKLFISISIDGPKNLHDRLRGIKCWENAIKTYQLIKPLTEVYFGFTLSSHNTGQLKATYTALKEQIPNLNLSDIHVNVMHQSDHYYANNPSEILDVSDLKWYASNLHQHGLLTRFQKTYCKGQIKYMKTKRHPLDKCIAGRSTVTVTPNGDVYPCLQYNKKLGSLREHGFDLNKIIKGKFKTSILNECPHCWTGCEAFSSIISSPLNIFR